MRNSQSYADFFVEILFRYWSWEAFGVLFAIIPFSVPSNMDLAERLLIVAVIFILVFVVKLIKQSHYYYTGYLRPLKVVREFEGEGAFSGKTVLAIENPGYISNGDILQLHDGSKGELQPVCLLRVVKARARENVLSIPVEIPEEVLMMHFRDSSKRESLRVMSIVNDSLYFDGNHEDYERFDE